MNNRRKNTPKAEQELYQLSKQEVKQFVEQERRKDELSRLREVQSQNRVWYLTVLVCGLFNMTLIGFAFLGWYQGL